MSKPQKFSLKFISAHAQDHFQNPVILKNKVTKC